MSRYGLFNETRSLPAYARFFALQVAVSSYPGDPLRKQLDAIVGKISVTQDRAEQCALASEASRLLSGAVRFTEYALWDYTLIPSVANKEFLSWVDGIQEIASAPVDKDDVVLFLPDDTSYFVATLTMLSGDSS